MPVGSFILWLADIALIQTNENIPPHTLASTLAVPYLVIDWDTVSKKWTLAFLNV